MKTLPAWTLLVSLTLAIPSLAQTEPPRNDPNAAPVFLMTDNILRLAVDRIADDMATHYQFDDDQHAFVREEIAQRFPVFFAENRTEIVQIANEYVEALLGAEPPTPEMVANWAARTQPLIQNFVGLVEETSEAIRPMMTDEQQTKMEGELAAMRVGVDYMNNRLEVWKSGGYDWTSEWPRSEDWKEKERVRQREIMRQQKIAEYQARGEEVPAELLNPTPGAAEAGVPTDATQLAADQTQPKPQPKPAATPDKPRQKDEWDIYVDQFIAKYKLDDAQQNSARKILHSLQDQRDRYLRRRAPDIDSLGTRIAAAKTDEERTKLRADLDKINEPIERYFSQLKDRLDSIPTRKQRADAAKLELQKDAAKTGEGEKKP